MKCRIKEQEGEAGWAGALQLDLPINRKSRETPNTFLMCLAIVAVMTILIVLFMGCKNAHAFETETSYFTYQSCIREGTSGICANGQRLVDTDLVAASWDFPLNSYIRVTNSKGVSVVCKVADRGPAKRLYRKGRKLDLSAAAFKKLAGGSLDRGLLRVEVEAI